MWYELGIALGLNSKVLSEIKGKHSSNLLRCKREMFRAAVKEGVTWERVVRGINDIGLREVSKNVITLFGIPTVNGLSSLVFSAESEEASYSATVLFTMIIIIIFAIATEGLQSLPYLGVVPFPNKEGALVNTNSQNHCYG